MTEIITSHSPCPVCKSKIDLSRCAACKVVSYCGRNHQLEDRDAHKRACTAIKKARTTMERERRVLEEEGEQSSIGGSWGDYFDPLGDAMGHFWGIVETRDYMRARWAEVDAVLNVKNPTAVEFALESSLNMLNLCRSDNLGVRDRVPFLMLRAGRDQDAYDFTKWYQTTGQDSHYDWGNIDNPFLDVKDADVFEPLSAGCYTSSNYDLAHICAVMLLKIKILLDLRSLQNAQIIGAKVPQELLDCIEAQLVSDVVRKKIRGTSNQSVLELIERLKVQIKELHPAITVKNKHYWQALLNPKNYLNLRPAEHSFGSREHMVLVLHYSYDAWAETPGALEVVAELEQRRFA